MIDAKRNLELLQKAIPPTPFLEEIDKVDPTLSPAETFAHLKETAQKYNLKIVYSAMNDGFAVLNTSVLEPHRKEIQDMLLELPVPLYCFSDEPVRGKWMEDPTIHLTYDQMVVEIKKVVLNILREGGDIFQLGMCTQTLNEDNEYEETWTDNYPDMDNVFLLGQALDLVNPILPRNIASVIGQEDPTYQIMLKKFIPPVDLPLPAALVENQAMDMDALWEKCFTTADEESVPATEDDGSSITH